MYAQKLFMVSYCVRSKTSLFRQVKLSQSTQSQRCSQVKELTHDNQLKESTHDNQLKESTHDNHLKESTHDNQLKESTHDDQLKESTHDDQLKESTHDELFQSTHEWIEGEEFSGETLHVANVHIALNLLHLHHLHK